VAQNPRYTWRSFTPPQIATYVLKNSIATLGLMVDVKETSSPDQLDGSLPNFQGLIELCKGLMNRTLTWRPPKGRCRGNQLKSQNWHFSWKNFHCRVAIPKQIGISERQWAA